MSEIMIIINIKGVKVTIENDGKKEVKIVIQ